MILKNVSKRTLALFLAAIMVFLLLPLSPMTPMVASAAQLNDSTTIPGLTIKSSDSGGKVTLNGTTLKIECTSGTVTSGSGCDKVDTPIPTSETVTFTNTSEVRAILSFDRAISLNNGNIFYGDSAESVSNTADNSTGTYTKVLEVGESVAICVKSNAAQVETTTLTLEDIKLAPSTSVTVVFKPVSDGSGSYTVDGVTIQEETPFSKQSSESYTLVATPSTDDYALFGWYNETTGKYLSYNNNISLLFDSASVIYPVFYQAELPIFGVGSAPKNTHEVISGVTTSSTLGITNTTTHYQDVYSVSTITKTFYDFKEAIEYADASSTEKVIVVLASGTLPSDTYVIPKDVMLLVPFDESNTYCAADPWSEICSSSSVPTPYAFRTLTLSAGTNIIVNGTIEVAARHYISHGGNPHGGHPVDGYGHIVMQESSQIVLNNGSHLYAWGYITASASAPGFSDTSYPQVIANSGATIYEKMQVTDYRGGNRTTAVTKDGHFPFNQYYIQNIEVKEVVNTGAELICHAAIYADSVQEQTVNFMGTEKGNANPMFALGPNSKATKYYDASNDRLIVDVVGDFSFNSISLMGEDTANFVLPLQQNLTINLNDGTVAKINQDIMLQPGCQINVGEGAELEIASGKKLYLMDADQWGNLCGAASAPIVPLTFVPTKGAAPGIRNSNNIKDANLNIRGTLIVSGAIYASASHAIVSGEGDSGVIEFRAAASASSQIKLATTSTEGTLSAYQADWTTVAMTPIVLTNTDGSTVDTKGTAAGTNYYFHCDIWQTGKELKEKNVAPTCTEGGSYDLVFRCTECNEEFSRTPITVAAAGHTPGEAVIENNKAPGCTTAGSYVSVVYCTVCNAEISRTPVTVDALGHTPGEAVVENTIAPGCTTAGSYDSVVYCAVCNEELSRETIAISATGHHYEAAITAPTCTNGGYTTYTCACGDTYIADETAATGHKLENGVCIACGAVCGDVNGNGEIDVGDCVVLRNYILGEAECTEEDLVLFDFNGDGEISILDCVRLRAYILENSAV